jgi:hypothetical protein
MGMQALTARCAIGKDRRRSGKTPLEGQFFPAASTMLVMKGSPDVRQKSRPPLSSAGRWMGALKALGEHVVEQGRWRRWNPMRPFL